MGEYHINGGKKLSGEIRVGGSKNAVLPQLAATILNGDISVLHDVPRISDVFVSIEILQALGAEVKLEGNTLTVNTKNISNASVPDYLMREMRSSVLFMGSLLGRFGECTLSRPGGCELGLRPIDLHINSLRKMNAAIDDEGIIECKAKKLKGAKINLDFPSVGATENIMLAASLADGTTIMSNAAKEPEIIDLQIFLNKMGAKVYGAGTDTITIEGKSRLNRAEHSVMSDRIIAGTYLVAAAITGGEIFLTNAVNEDICPITNKLKDAGCTIKTYGSKVHLKAPSRIKPIPLMRTHPHPGFPTDAQPQFMSLLSVADGTSIVVETVFESRNKHISELRRLGADIFLAKDGMTSLINGVPSLTGAVVSAKDLRGGVALITAGLIAEGNTVVENSNYVERGYECIEDELKSLGADIKLVS